MENPGSKQSYFATKSHFEIPSDLEGTEPNVRLRLRASLGPPRKKTRFRQLQLSPRRSSERGDDVEQDALVWSLKRP